MAVSCCLSACQQDEALQDLPGETDETTQTSTPDVDYFTATFFANPMNAENRAAITGNSERIQSLVCLIFRQGEDGTYHYVTEKTVINYEGTEGNITPQTYRWPLEVPVTFNLPNGEYKAVFVGNVQPELFADQKTQSGTVLEPILTGYKDGFSRARIHMPQKGPLAFNNYNMFYLCVVDFNRNNASPYVLLQRIVSNNIYTRNFIDTKQSVSKLVNNIVADIRENQLTTDVIKGLLHTSILDALSKGLGLDKVLPALTAIVDHLVNGLLGDILSMLNKALVQELTTRLETSLNGQAGNKDGLLGLGYLLNPWTHNNTADLVYKSMTESVDFNKMACTSYQANVEWKNVPITEGKDKTHSISVTCLSGTEQVSEINVSRNDGYMGLLRPILGQLDEQLLNGLLVNIHSPLKYSMEPNLQYATTYELLDLKLKDPSKIDPQGLTVELPLNDIVNLEELVKGLLGDGLIGGLVGSLAGNLLQPIVDILLKHTLKFVNIQLPNLGLGNLQLHGTWDATLVSDGTVAPSLPAEK